MLDEVLKLEGSKFHTGINPSWLEPISPLLSLNDFVQLWNAVEKLLIPVAEKASPPVALTRNCSFTWVAFIPVAFLKE